MSTPASSSTRTPDRRAPDRRAGDGPVVEVASVPTPVGDLSVACAGDRVVALAWADHLDRVAGPVRAALGGDWVEADPVDPPAPARAVAAYVAGDLAALDDVEVHPVVHEVATPFRRRVWAALRAIPVGTTASYAELAAAVGDRAATRAVGSANGANPVWLVVPCHRVVRSDGSLGGYGGGVDRKAWLLSHEGARPTPGGEPDVPDGPEWGADRVPR